MKIKRLFLIAAIGFLVLLSRQSRVQALDLLAHEPQQVVVQVAPGVDIDTVNLIFGTTTLETMPEKPDIHLLQAPAGTSLPGLVQWMSGSSLLAYAELNYLTEAPESGSTNRIYGWNSSSYNKYQSAAKSMDLDDVHAYSEGENTLIAILDTGIQAGHPAFSGRISPLGFDFVDLDSDPSEETNGLDDDQDGRVDEGFGHGTHVSGIAHLVAPDALLLPVRVLNSDSRGNIFRTAMAVYYAAANGADVINMSLGSSAPSRTLGDAIDHAAAAGVVVVAAAGNTDNSVKQYPAAEDCALAVTSVFFKRNTYSKSSFAAFGDWISLSAPGDKISSTFPYNIYAASSGTSMSAPFVSGQAGLLRSMDPMLTLDEVGMLIGGSAKPITGTPYTGLLGEGMQDILASLLALKNNSLLDPGKNLFAACTDG